MSLLDDAAAAGAAAEGFAAELEDAAFEGTAVDAEGFGAAVVSVALDFAVCLIVGTCEEDVLAVAAVECEETGGTGLEAAAREDPFAPCSRFTVTGL